MNEIIRTGWDVLDEARAMLRAAVAGVPADGWQRLTPCTEWNVTQVLQHAALDQGAWAAVILTVAIPLWWLHRMQVPKLEEAPLRTELSGYSY